MYKITKGMARKLYNEGAEVMIIPNRIRTDSMLAGWITKPQDNSVSFEQACNAIHYYNCSPETGMELAYYAKEV
jgi:hypothetical protein